MFGIGRKKEDTEFETITPFTSTSSEKTDEGFETITPLTKVEPQKAPGLLEQTWRGVGRGVTKDIPEMLGAPFKFLGADEFGDAIGKSLEDYQPESKGGIVEQGVEGFVAFAPAMLTKALQIPTNIALSLDTYNKTKEEAEKAGVSNPGALAAFHGGATFATLMALGKFGESITNPAFKSILGKAAKKTPQEIISPTLGSAVKDIALHGALATGMFSAQTALGAVVDKETGFRPDADPLQDVKEMLGPMGVMMGLGAASGLGVRALHTRGANRMADILNDRNADPVQRGVIADSIGKYLEKSNPDAAKAWGEFSDNRIKNKENIPLDMNLSDKLDLSIESAIDKHESGSLLKTDTKNKKPIVNESEEEAGVLDNLNNLEKNLAEQKAKQEAKRKEAAAADAPEFDVPSTVETKRTDLPVSFFKNQRGVSGVDVGENGELRVRYKNGLNLTVKSVDHINENEVDLKVALGRTNLKTGENITGSYKDSVVKLVKNKAGEFTWHHESAHFAEDMGLITKEERIVLQKKIQKLVKEGKLTTKSEDGTDIGGAEDRADYLAKIKLSGEEPTGTIKKIFTKMQEWVDRMVEGYKLKTGQAPSAKIIERAFKTGRVFERRISNIEKMMKKEGAPSVLTDEFIKKATQQGIDFTDTIQKANFVGRRLIGLLDSKEMNDKKLSNLSKMGYASARKALAMAEAYKKQLNDIGITDEQIAEWRKMLESKEESGSLLGFNDVVNGVGGIKNAIHEANKKKVGPNFLGDSNNIVKAFNNMPGEIDKAYYSGKQMMEEGTPVKKKTGVMAKNRESAKKLRESVFEGRTESLADKGMMDTRLPKEQPSIEKDKEKYHYNTNSPHAGKWEQYNFFKDRKNAYKLSEEDFIIKAWDEIDKKYVEGKDNLIPPPNYVGGDWVEYDLREIYRESIKNSQDTSTQSIKDHKMSFKMPANDNLTGKVFGSKLAETKGITFTESTGGYAERTKKNASADATIALATDFNTAGERLTKREVLSQGKKYIPIDANRITVTQERVDNVVNALNKANAKTLNIAGNGLYSMKNKYSQAQVDEFTKNLLQKVVDSPKLNNKIEKIVTGGQTGFDEAGAKAAIDLGIPVEVHAPKGWKFRDINGNDIYSGIDPKAKEKFMARFEGKAEERRTPVTSFKELPQRYKERYIKKYPGDTVAKNEYYGSMSDKELLQHIHDNPKDGDAINFRLRGMSNEKLDALRLAKPGNKWVEAEVEARKNPVPQKENPPQPRPEILALQKDISRAAEDIAKLTKEKYNLKNKNWTVDKAKQLQALEWTFEQLREKYEREFTVSDMQRNKNAEVKGFEEKRARAVDFFNRDISGLKEELERQRQAQRKIDTKEKMSGRIETVPDTAPEQGTIWSRMTDAKLNDYMNKYGVSEATKSIIKKELESRITTDENGNEKRNVPKEMKGQNKEMPSVERAMPSTEREIYRATRDGEERLLKFIGGLPSKKRGIIEEMRVYETAYKNTVDAKDYLKRSVMTAIGRFKALKDAYLREGGNYTNVQSHVMRWKGAMTVSNHGNSNIAKQLVDKFKDPLEREGMRNWLECEGDMGYLKMAYDESVKKGTKYADGYKAAMNLSPEAKEACGIIKGIYNEKLLDLIRLDMLEHGIDNYINNSWRSTAASEAMKNSFKDMNLDERKEYGSLHENPSFLYKRLFRTSLHGELNGFEHVSKDIGHSLVKYLTSMDEALASREMIKNMSMDKTSDGKKVFLISPDEPVKGAIDDNGKLNVDYRTMYNPKGYEDVTKLSKAIIKSQGINRADVGDINAYDYVYIDSPSLRNWKFLGTDVSGNPMVYKGSLWVHKEFAKHLKAILERSRIRSFKWEIAGKPYYPGEAALNLSQNLKGLLLSFSGFHQVQVGVHAVFHRVNPFKPLEIDLKDPDQKMLAEHGLNISDTKGLEYFSEGLTTGGGLVAKIPVLGQLFQKYATYLFKSYIPRLKMSMGVEAYNRNLKRYYQDGKGPMTKEQVAFLTAKQADAAFGELNYELMGRSKTTQDVLRLFLLAPDFLEARARFVGQALSPYGNSNVAKGIFNNEQFQAAIMTGTLGMWFGARIINAILNDGDMKFDKHFSVVTPKGMSLLGLDIGEREYALRSIPGDIEHLFKDPRSFAFFRVNPVFVKPFMEAIVGRDQFGRYRDSSQQLMDYISGFAPIPTQTKRGEWNAMESIMKSTGINVYRSRTSFEKKLLELKGHRASFSQTSDEKKRSDLINIFADKLGLAKTKADRDEIYTDVKNHIAGGKLFRKDLNTIKKYATEDRVERAIKQMQLEDVIKAWDDASDVEKKKYKSLFVKKVHNMQMNSPDRLKELMPDVKKIIQEK